MKAHTKIFRTTFAVASLALTFNAHALPFSQVFVFGDSLVDSGNNAAAIDLGLLAPFGIPAGTRTNPPADLLPPNDLIPQPPYTSNRYSNGPVWVEQFAASLGLTTTPVAPSIFTLPLDPAATSFASGGATMTSGASFPVPSVPEQVLAFSQALPTYGGSAPSDALYVINGGGNDVRAVLDGSLTLLQATNGYLNGTLQTLNGLWNLGARNFLLSTIPDVGLTPALLLADQLIPGAAATATALSAGLNQALFQMLQTQLIPELLDAIDILDLFGLQQQVFANPAAFGLTDVTSPCAALATCVNDPAGFFYWDGIHPTTAGHALIARAARAAIPEPDSRALVALAVLVLALQWRARARASA